MQQVHVDEPPADWTAQEADERAAADRSLYARLRHGPVFHAIGRADRAGMRFFRAQARSRHATHAIRSYSKLGEHGAAWLAIAAGGALLDRDRRREWQVAGISIATAYVVNTSLKQVARRPRPDFQDLPPLIATPGPLSFPSSHSASSAAAYVGLAPLLPAAPLAIATSTMAISRVHLGVHYPSDIAIGALIGAAVTHTLRRKLLPD